MRGLPFAGHHVVVEEDAARRFPNCSVNFEDKLRRSEGLTKRLLYWASQREKWLLLQRVDVVY